MYAILIAGKYEVSMMRTEMLGWVFRGENWFVAFFWKNCTSHQKNVNAKVVDNKKNLQFLF